MDLRRGSRNRDFLSVRTGLILGGIILFIVALFLLRPLLGGSGGINKGGYQLVNLTTGESFIGKLSGLGDEYVTLKSVYYQQKPSGQAGDTSSSQEITVVRLSSSVVKPEDTMHIARDKIVHWENLQDDSKVIQAIKGDQGNGSE